MSAASPQTPQSDSVGDPASRALDTPATRDPLERLGVIVAGLLVALSLHPRVEAELSSVAFQTGCSTRSQAEAEITALTQAVEMYQLERGRLPKALLDLAVSGLADKPRPDPWGQPYLYLRVGTGDFAIRSAGPDGVHGTLDDVYDDD